MTDTGALDLIIALVGLRERFGSDQVTASYVTPDGVLVTIAVYREFATISDDDGHVQALDLPDVLA